MSAHVRSHDVPQVLNSSFELHFVSSTANKYFKIILKIITIKIQLTSAFNANQSYEKNKEYKA
jgi:hypothetical protein